MFDRVIDTVFVFGRIWHAPDHAGILADTATVVGVKNSRRKAPEATILIYVCDSYAAFDIYAVHDIFCSVLRVVRAVSATYEVHRKGFAKVAAHYGGNINHCRFCDAWNEYL